MVVESTNARLENLLSACRAIYIIDSTGILLHHEFFFGQDEDPDLYSGLFSAVNTYAKQLDAGSINLINLEDHKFIFDEHKETGYLIVLDVFKDMTRTDGSWLLKQIIDRFEAMEKLMEEDFEGSLTLETLFEDRGKSINWNTLHSIREDAIKEKSATKENMETLNLTRINLKNRMWVKIRNIASTLVEHQKGLDGLVLFIIHNEHKNILYSGRDENKLKPLQNYLNTKVKKGLGLELETERVKLDERFCAIYPLLTLDGGLIAIASEDRYLITRLNNQMERLVASIEKLNLT